ncbi:hypothetical protein BU24DRAFT_19128 [Aaosphaeria arxii CBS 175.79]|uniref:Uncharacterized protein n=1 Tax=Aaosphaeria arxii CBS 175.79 TaxID=1450172 RepID=A0A6A5Y6X8_9PLEO|nr:uncharacterized protein BU24DRAFT_19128 [Aaosphaeria arxii CBS 175.79]KAF2021315.1 hypothetical protein BU24DRAFT_19128 [Aaosphaeria arxii CBS 175.79]
MVARNLFSLAAVPILAASALPAATSTGPTEPSPTNLDNGFWDSFSSNWTWPAPLDKGFLRTFYLENPEETNVNTTSETNDDVGRKTDLILAAVKNVTTPKEGEFGSDNVVVRVGDSLKPEFSVPESSTGKKRRVELKCLVCSKGSENGSIYDACDSYKDSSSVSFFYNATDPIESQERITLPALSSSLELPKTTVGLCMLTVSRSEESYADFDHSIPFAVTHEPREDGKAWLFNKATSTGALDAEQPTQSPAEATPPPQHKSNGMHMSGGAIAGIVVGFLVLCGMIGCVTVATRGSQNIGNEAKVIDETELGPMPSGDHAQGGAPGTAGAAAVERRVETDDNGEIPPSYQQAVATGEPQPPPATQPPPQRYA